MTTSVSVGMPVFNGGDSLYFALDTLLAQTFYDFELIISDNASTDQTESICRTYANRDKRIRYFRQIVNLGAEANFLFVLERSVGKYFMWAAADDVRSPDFIELNFNFLENNPDYVCSISPVRFEGADFDEKKMGDRSLDEDHFDLRIINFFNGWHANCTFYSLIRTETLKTCAFVGKKFLGADWSVVLYLIQQGKSKRLKEGWLERGIGGVSYGSGIFKRYRSTLLDVIAPFWKMTGAVFSLSRTASFASRIIILWKCLVMNAWALKLQMLGCLYGLYKSMLVEMRKFINGKTSS